ncbi:unnamed protein product [Paramecium primaurelia]|uniref:FPL domain-containing protein n=1 Tax=Paramecium primaurelia TaxID=5886 RepID=A0A8S1L4C1_PARPR|nr:unnamed protein product [Paramecium primaurelia]
MQSTQIFSLNLKNPLNITYLLSNPVLNEFINHEYDFSDQEMVEFYVNFLKIIAIRINRENIYLYFNQRYCSFPLLWQAQKFINYPETLVQNTVKVIILSISKLCNLTIDVSLTQSIIKQENLIIQKFKNYLLNSPFIIAYHKYIQKIKYILPNITQSEFQNQFEELFMFFNDLLNQCPFLIPLFEQILLQELILPIMNYLLLNKKTDIKIEFKLGFYFLHQILYKLPLKNIFIYFSQDKIPNESYTILKYHLNQSVNWVYEIQDYKKEFEQVYLDENQNQIIGNQSQNNLINNNYKYQMLHLLKHRDNSILLLQLAIWQVIKSHQKPWPINQIIELLSQPQNQIMHSIKVINFIILFFINEDTNKLKQIYQEYENKVKQLIINAKNDKSQLSQDLIINWEIIQNFDWNTFKKSLPTITFDDLQNWVNENELNQFKLVYIWLLLKCLVMNFKKEPQNAKYVPNQEISHLTDDLYIQIDDKRTYLIISSEQGYIIQTIACSNPNRGIVTFTYPLAGISCTQEKDYLKFECNKLAINQLKPAKIKIPINLMNDIILKINDVKLELQQNTFEQLQQLCQ